MVYEFKFLIELNVFIVNSRVKYDKEDFEFDEFI